MRYGLLGAVATLSMVASASGTTWYVDSSVGASGNGLTPSTAFKFLQDALAVATSGDSVIIYDGVYRPDESTAGGDSDDVNATFTIPAGVTIQGSGEGTLLNGRISGGTGCTGNSKTVVVLAGPSSGTSTTTLEDLVIEQGCNGQAGGLLADSASLNVALNRVVIQTNQSSIDASGALIRALSISVIDCKIAGNSSGTPSKVGGAWLVGLGTSSTVSVLRTAITGNSAAEVGGILVAAPNVEINTTLISGNTISNGVTRASRAGGLGAESTGSLDIVRSVISDNLSGENRGAGLSMIGGDLRIWNSIIDSNGSKSDAVSMYIDNEATQIVNTQIRRNTSSGNPDAVGASGIIKSDTISLVNNSIVGNRSGASSSGSIRLESSAAVSIYNCLF